VERESFGEVVLVELARVHPADEPGYSRGGAEGGIVMKGGVIMSRVMTSGMAMTRDAAAVGISFFWSASRRVGRNTVFFGLSSPCKAK